MKINVANIMNKRNWKCGGFSLVELMAVFTIIIILAGTFLINYRESGAQLTLNRAANKVAQDARRAQEMAMAARNFPGAGVDFKGGYGIHFDKATTSYFLFADNSDNGKMEPPEIVEEISLEEKIKIKKVDLMETYDLGSSVFYPPEPEVVNYLQVGAFSNNPLSLEITLSLINNEAVTKTIIINSVGLIYVE